MNENIFDKRRLKTFSNCKELVKSMVGTRDGLIAYNETFRIDLENTCYKASRYEMLQQKLNQLEEDYKNEVEENLKLSELWKKSQEEKRQLETNRDEALKFIKYEWYYDGTPIDKIEEILERGKE